MDAIEQLQIIRDANGEPALLALATVDLTFPNISDEDRTDLRFALEAAAVPHWCNAGILAELIDSTSQSGDLWERLKKVPVIEPFQARGADTGNVHEANRLAIRKHLAKTQQKKFIEFSTRSARVFNPIGVLLDVSNGFTIFLWRILTAALLP